MCEFKSGILLKDRVYIGDKDHHSDMLKVLNIEDSRKNAETLFVRAELIPPNRDVFSDIDTWRFNVDQDILPEWFVEDYEKTRMVEAVKEWAERHIFVDTNDLEINVSGTVYLKNCKNATLYGNSTATLYDNSTATLCDNSTATLRGNSTATLCDNSTATLRGNSTATLWDNSTATLCDNSTATLRGNSTATLRGNSTATLRGNSTATLCDNSTATLRGNSTATLYDNSTATLYGNSTATLYGNSTGILLDVWFSSKKENYVLMENSTLKDCKAKTIYQSGDWKFVAVENQEAVK